MEIRFEKTGSSNTMVFVDGAFAFHLTRVRRTRTELGGNVSWYEWEGTFKGRDVRGNLTQCRKQIGAAQ